MTEQLETKPKDDAKTQSLGQPLLFIYSAQPWYTRNECVREILGARYEVDEICSHGGNYLIRLLSVCFQYLRLPNKNRYSMVYVGFLAQALIPLVRLFYRGKVASDYFISLFDTICRDRQTIGENSLLAKMLFRYEKWTMGLSDTVLVDTEANREYLSNLYNFPLEKIKVLYVLPNRNLFYPRDSTAGERFSVFFYGSAQPLHGIKIILTSAKLLEKEGIDFLVIGPFRNRHRQFIDDLKLTNVQFMDWVAYESLPASIAPADVCLAGHFGGTDKAKRTIPGKALQFVAMRKPVIVGDSRANREIFADRVNCRMVEMDNAVVLAEAIRSMRNDPALRAGLAAQAYADLETMQKRVELAPLV